MTTDEDFLAAWRAWDARPGDPRTAGPFEQACAEKSSEFHLRRSDLRDLLASWRRAGFSRPLALTALRAGVEAISTPVP